MVLEFVDTHCRVGLQDGEERSTLFTDMGVALGLYEVDLVRTNGVSRSTCLAKSGTLPTVDPAFVVW